MAQPFYENAEERMKKALSAFKRELSSLRAGRATPALLDRIHVEYYGTQTPLNQVASITSPDPRTLMIQPWDKSSLGDIEKSILKSDLGLTPNNDGNMIRISIPVLTEERRADLVKMLRKYAEEAKVNVRNVRRDANDEIKKMEKDSISEDESRRYQDDIQKITDRYVSQIDTVTSEKENEIKEV